MSGQDLLVIEKQRVVAAPPAIANVRLALPTDAPFVLKLVNEQMGKTFRIHSAEQIVYLIENSVLAITQFNESGDIIGFISAREYPLIPSVHPMAWEEYIWTKYKAIEMNGRNTLFLHLLCWNIQYSREVVDNMLRSIFMHDPYLQFIAFVKTVIGCLQLVPGTSRPEGSFRRLQTTERGVPGELLPALYIADRKEVCPRLRVRRAVEEDNDDIVPIIDRHSTRLRELYGDYYISELISRHPESERTLIVCEYKEVAVGVICLNTEINFEALEDSYDLSPFAGFRHADTDHRAKLSKLAGESSVSFLGDGDMGMELTPLLESPFDVSATREDVEKEDSVHESMKERFSASSEAYSHIIMDWINEDEEIEFDIINIDPELLIMPDFLSPGDNIYKNIIDGRKLKTDSEVIDGQQQAHSKRETKRSVTSSVSIVGKPEPVIRYTGAPNAVLLELFAMDPDIDERYGFDMLDVVFQMFPERDYLILCLPAREPPFPLLEHFTLVAPRSGKSRFINESMYVAHVNSVCGEMRVRPGEAADVDNLVDILEHVRRRDVITDLFENSITDCGLESFVFLSENQPVGIAIIGPLEDGAAIRTQYDLNPEPVWPNTDGTILAGVLSPVMEPHARWFLREIMRRTRYTSLFWVVQTFAKGDLRPSHNLMSMSERMVPVRPRHPIPNMTGNKELDIIFKDISSPFALWMIDRPTTSLPKVNVNNSIVVVGASRTGLAFLEALIMGPTSKYLTFTNLTLVSDHGLPMVNEYLKAAETCLPREGKYTDQYLRRIPFSFYVDVMTAILVKIDRKKKCLYFKGGGIKYYDELVLCVGKQFQHPDYLKESLFLVKEINKGKPCDRMLMDNPKYQPDKVPPPPELPENVMLVNNLSQSNIAFRKLLKMISEQKGVLCTENPIVVYGDCIEAYCCMAGLLELGIMSWEIAFVEPFPADDPNVMRINCFNDEVVDERVQDSLEALGIRVYRKCRLSSWKRVQKRVVSLRLMSIEQCIYLPCFALFYFGLRAINIHAFKAINESGLVYDGGLVVGPQFETNDPHIYGAGTCTQYSRKLYASQYIHGYYSSEDVGNALAQLFLRKFDPFVMMNPDFSPCPSELLPRYNSSMLRDFSHSSIPECPQVDMSSYREWKPVMKFESPILIAGTFPGPLYYMKLRKPGPDVPMEVQKTLPQQGHTLLTDKDNNYFRLQLNVLHVISAVTCLSSKPFSVDVMGQLYGKHEAFFNKLLIRYQMEQIEDFFEYFMRPWMAAIYQETFDTLMNDINYHDIGKCTCHYEHEAEFLKPPRITEKIERVQGTFREAVSQFIAPDMFKLPPKKPNAQIPSECGQNAFLRNKARMLWEKVGGEKIVFSHISNHITQHSVTNPHYAPPKTNIPLNDEIQTEKEEENPHA